MKIKTLSLLRGIARTAAALAVISTLAFPLATAGTTPPFTDANWISMGGRLGANGEIFATQMDSSGNLYVCGNFTTIGDVAAKGIAKWDGTNWTALGSGIDGGSAYALATSGNDLYAGGTFLKAGEVEASRVAKWNGTNWSALGAGVEFEGSPGLAAVLALAVSGNNVYAGGQFNRAGGLSASPVARWNGSSWSALGTGGSPNEPVGSVYALAIVGNDLYAGGHLFQTGSVDVFGIGKWNGSAWSALGSGLSVVGGDPFVVAVAVSGSDLYVAGNFDTAGGIAARHVAKWNGSAWSALGTGPGGSGTSALAISDGVLYAGGYEVKTVGSDGWVRRWNGSIWVTAAPTMGSPVTDLSVNGNTVYAGTYTNTSIGGRPISHIASWNGSNGSSWSVLGSGHGLDGPVRAMAISGNDVYVGGEFRRADGAQLNRIAKWNGTSWSALGTGMDYHVSALAVAGNGLYALGPFTNAGGVRVDGLARWNGSAWSDLNSGPSANRSIWAIAAIGNDLYVGGRFSSIGGSSVSNLARWNGGSWSSVGGGVNSWVRGLAVSGTNLFHQRRWHSCLLYRKMGWQHMVSFGIRHFRVAHGRIRQRRLCGQRLLWCLEHGI